MEKILEILQLKSENNLEKAEGLCILSLFASGLILSFGIGLSILNTKGISAILAMLGSLFTFLSTLALIIVWLIKEWKK
ncbi:MAG: hypothetical protein GF368_04460 [Candidatus Aenigmarchaeota archaeon]|nr:hypothetical protein [Candidatus Aenigmarchaeota archaeon]